jgi:hypothetical protein
MPEVSTAALALALAACARAEGVSDRKQILLVVDGAPWPTTPRLPVPRGLHLVQLPPATPELPPAERLWPLLNEGLANRPFARLGTLERAMVRRCRQVVGQQELIRRLTCSHWWPNC